MKSGDDNPKPPAAQFASELAMLVWRWSHEADLSYAEIAGILAAAQHKVLADALDNGGEN
jgi:hypothetical protein